MPGYTTSGLHMRITSTVATTLPTLRRYARAVTGSQTTGDDLVAKVLEHLVAQPHIIKDEQSAKIGLYRQFLRLANKGDDGANEAAVEDAATMADRRLSRLSPRPRQAYLLRALEGFTAEESAYALDTTLQEFAHLVDRANQEMIDQVATDVLIIEDEPMIALDLKDIMTSLGHRVTAIARTHREALDAMGGGEIGLVLADIQLADGSSGIEAVNDILLTMGVPIVFITAFPERLLTGERPEPTFLITKPFQPENIKAITSQALFFDLKARRRDALAQRALDGTAAATSS
jgi:DNA-directed RNA polymerase specialized sigma24 family protein/CheY-like chemotaxis protein